jgi:transcriptional regulator GlxA family with amidase domain
MTSFKLWVAFIFVFMVSSVYAESKKVGVVVFDGVLTSDVTAPLEVFGVASKLSWFSDYEVITIGVNSTQQITTEEGLTIGVDTWIGDAPKLDVLLLPSSYNMNPLLKNKALIQFIQSHAKQVDWLASNCSGSFLLGEAGVLDGKKATTWAGGESDLQQAYSAIDVQFDTNVVVDGNVITSNGSVVSYQAALTLLKMMTSERKANEVAEAIQYARFSNQPY